MNYWLPRLGLYLGPLSFLLIYFLISSPDLNPEAQTMLALTLWMAIWWITEAMPIAATSFLPLILMPLFGLLDIESVSANYMHPTVLLYMGGFLMATGIEKWNLHRRIALNIINLLGTNLRKIVLGFILATGFLSMWISNSATALMMLPIGLAVVNQFKVQLGSNQEHYASNLGKNIMLGIAYSASIGGMATLIGTPTNSILVAVVKELYDYSIGFNDWFAFGLPLVIILLLVCWYFLVSLANPLPKSFDLKESKSIIINQLKSLGKISFEEKTVLVVFLLVCLSWVSRSFILIKIFHIFEFLFKLFTYKKENYV